MSFLSFFPQIPTVTTASAAPVYHGGMIPCLGDVEPVNTRWLIKEYAKTGEKRPNASLSAEMCHNGTAAA